MAARFALVNAPCINPTKASSRAIVAPGSAANPTAREAVKSTFTALGRSRFAALAHLADVVSRLQRLAFCEATDLSDD